MKRDIRQVLAVHQQRRGLFESPVVNEHLESRYNSGFASSLYFWRSNTGDGIDAIVERGNTLVPVEAKSGQTIASDSLRGIEGWRQISVSTEPGWLVYGGTKSLRNGADHLLCWRDLPEARELLA